MTVPLPSLQALEKYFFANKDVKWVFITNFHPLKEAFQQEYTAKVRAFMF